jgi:hypothetical protein
LACDPQRFSNPGYVIRMSSDEFSLYGPFTSFKATPQWKRVAMNCPDTSYAWQQPFITAVCETDNGLMLGRIYEALAAIEQRRLSPVLDIDEDRALTAALEGLERLMERTEKPV